jgi:signal peptidase II
MLSTGLRWTWISLAIICLDQASKYLIVRKLFPFVPYPIVPSMNFYLTFNRGTAMSIFRSANWTTTFVSLLVVCVLIIWLSRLPGRFSISSSAIAMIVGGALGNLLDRLHYGHVVDFIQVYWRGWSFYIFNIADICITVGVGGLILASFREGHKQSQ